jgi:hypothetical protein
MRSNDTEVDCNAFENFDRRCCITAASIYFAMLSIPGSRTRVFNAFTLRSAMKTIQPDPSFSNTRNKKREHLTTHKRKRVCNSKQKLEIQCKSAMTRLRRSCRQNSKSHEESDDNEVCSFCLQDLFCDLIKENLQDDLSVMVTSNEGDLSVCSANRSNSSDDHFEDLKLLDISLEQAYQMLTAFSLQTHPDSITHCAEILVSAAFTYEGRAQDLSFLCLKALLNRQHGDPDQALTNIYKNMVPWLIEAPSSQFSASALGELSSKALAFIRETLDCEQSDDEAVIPIRCLCES